MEIQLYKYGIGKLKEAESFKRYSKELKATPKEMNQSMTNGRVTSLKERIEIVYYCIAKNKDYKQTADVHNVSYE